MGKRDAFGNEINENPLDAMGWKVGDPVPDAAVGAPTTPVANVGEATASFGTEAPVAAAPAPATPIPPAPKAPVNFPTPPRFSTPQMPSRLPNIPGGSAFGAARAISRLVTVVVFLAIFGGIGAAVWSAVSIPRFTTPQVNLPGITTPTPTPGKQPETPVKPTQPPTGLGARSLLRADAFGASLVKIREQGGRVQTMRVDPTRISANVIGSDNTLKIVSVTWEGALQTIKTSSRLTGVSTVSLNAVNSKAPSRALARSAKLLGRPASAFNYMVLLNLAGSAKWVVYFKDGKYVQASLDGRSVQRVN
jgi:hypothetical protein